jgi:hypothetical protein
MPEIPASQFWLFRWLEESEVRNLADARRLLNNGRGLDRLREYAQQHPSEAPDLSAFSIVAGRGADLSGILDCNAPKCRIRQVDTLLKHSWHYFDQAVVEDAVSHEVTHHWDAPVSARRTWILGHVRVLLHLRDIGAVDLVRFYEKPPPCEVHWEGHAAEAGLEEAVERANEFVTELVRDARIRLSPSNSGGIDFALVHPCFEHTVWGQLPVASTTDVAELKRFAAHAVYRRYLANLTSDVRAARELSLPVGSAVWFHGRILRGLESGSSPDEVAFHLELPVLRDVALPQLLQIRRDESDAFLRFRLALRKAASERAWTSASRDAASIAKEIQHDLIEPELQLIQSRLKTAERMLAKKSGVALTLGVLATTCGLLAGVSPELATMAGMAALSAVVGSAAAKDIEERREASLSDMYFLWKAVEHAH